MRSLAHRPVAAAYFARRTGAREPPRRSVHAEGASRHRYRTTQIADRSDVAALIPVSESSSMKLDRGQTFVLHYPIADDLTSRRDPLRDQLRGLRNEIGTIKIRRALVQRQIDRVAPR